MREERGMREEELACVLVERLRDDVSLDGALLFRKLANLGFLFVARTERPEQAVDHAGLGLRECPVCPRHRHERLHDRLFDWSHAIAETTRCGSVSAEAPCPKPNPHFTTSSAVSDSFVQRQAGPRRGAGAASASLECGLDRARRLFSVAQ